ncbi:MAG: phosphonate metabolism protein/1,5-bisphosphokinase (PRPP-forming) PhnN [Pseudomonadota bacterium]
MDPNIAIPDTAPCDPATRPGARPAGHRQGPGRLILVVGPSGAGKDTLLDGARTALDGTLGLGFAQRVVTRPADAGGEAHEPATMAAFERMVVEDALFVHWQAHGLGYGTRAAAVARLAAGEDIVLNGSRAAVPAILARWAATAIVHVTAPEAVIAARLARRGREDPTSVEKRRKRVVPPLPHDVPVITVSNDQDVAAGVARLVDAIVAIRALPADAFAAKAPKGGPVST